MNLMQEWLARAAAELGLRVSLGHVTVLPDCRKLTSQALFPDLGAELGTLVFDAAEQLDAAASKELRARGYTASSFRQPLPREQFDLQNYAEMFCEWGWTGNPEGRPAWMGTSDKSCKEGGLDSRSGKQTGRCPAVRPEDE